MQGNLRTSSPSYSLIRPENFQPLRVTSLDTESALNITHKVSVLVELNSRGAEGVGVGGINQKSDGRGERARLEPWRRLANSVTGPASRVISVFPSETAGDAAVAEPAGLLLVTARRTNTHPGGRWDGAGRALR